MHELSYLLDFRDEHLKLLSSESNYKSFTSQKIRFICVVLISLPYLTAALFWDFHHFFVPFTNWTLIMTTLSLFMTINGARDTRHYNEWSLKKRRA